jgi:tetratricopeptide (TPR) repeat protein
MNKNLTKTGICFAVLLMLTANIIFWPSQSRGQSGRQTSGQVIEMIRKADSFLVLQDMRMAQRWALKAKAQIIASGFNDDVATTLLAARVFGDVYQPGFGFSLLDRLVREKVMMSQGEETRVRNLMAELTFQMGEYNDAAAMYEENLAQAEARGLDSLKGLSWLGLSRVSGVKQERLQQLRFLQDAMALAQRKGYGGLEAEALMIKGDYYILTGSLSESRESFLQAQRLFASQKDSAGILSARLRGGWVAYLMKDYRAALAEFRQGLSVSIRMSNHFNIANAYGNIGTVLRDMNQTDSAAIYYQKGIDEAAGINDYYNISWICFDRYEMFRQLGDLQKALDSYILHKQYSDSLEAQQSRRYLEQTRAVFEEASRQQQFELLSVKLKQQWMLVYSLAGGGILIIVILTLVILQIRLNNRRKMAEIKRSMTELTQMNLRQQMNPHFIFNILNSVQYAIYQKDTVTVNEYLGKFSLLMRKTLENSRHATITLKEELDMAALYLDLEAIRFKDKLTWVITADDEIDTLDCRVPAMLIHPFVENAISHGLKNKPGPGHVAITLTQEEDRIRCVVEDDGIGRKAAALITAETNARHQSLGTAITQSRVQLINELYAKDLNVAIEDLYDPAGKPNGTRVVIYLPIFFKR